MSEALSSDIRSATTGSIVLSILMIASGVVAVLVPTIAGAAVTVIVGGLLIFGGFIHLGFAFRAATRRAVLVEILLGVIYAVAGAYLIARPIGGLISMTLAVAAYLFVEGILEFVLSFELRPAPGTGWLLFDGVVTLLLAGLIAATWPSSALWVVGTLVGISVLLSGITRLMFTMAVRRIAA